MRQDIHIQIIDPGQQTFGETVTFDLADPILVSGLQGLANRWLKLFLTPKGSHPVRKTEGTEFAYLQGSNVDSQLSLQALVDEYVEDATLQIQAQDRRNPQRQAVDRLQTASVVLYNQLAVDKIEFWVELTNAAGQRLPVLIPYKVLT